MELQNEKRSLDVLISEWIALLISIAQNGYFMHEGIRPVLLEMVRYGYKPKTADFPTYLDQISFNCILTIYKQVQMQ